MSFSALLSGSPRASSSIHTLVAWHSAWVFSEHSAPEKIEQDLMALLPRQEWDRANHTLIFHGRRICSARKPACSICPVNSTCPSAFQAEDIGRKPPRVRV